ncbi:MULTISPECIES: hypothetical protein [Clostridium]|uniref:Uncharacterized protein n=1 Tax=Clostridium lapidicellarium TaxID=3240931 RepID=A0ABV4DY96_9CLOT
MKKYSTLKALSMLDKDKKLKFEIIPKKDPCTQTISTNEFREIVIDCKGCYGQDKCGINFNDMWTLAQQPVSFMEAVKSKKKIRVEHPRLCKTPKYYWLGELMHELSTNHIDNILADIILEGKWYIKEDEEETTCTDKTKFIEINYKDLRDNERHTKYFSTYGEYEEWHKANWNDVVING